MAGNDVEKLKVQQEIPKANARSRVFETSTVERRGLKIKKYNTEAQSTIGKLQQEERTQHIDQSRHGEKYRILFSQDMGKEYWIFLNQGKKEIQLAWKMKKLTEQ